MLFPALHDPTADGAGDATIRVADRQLSGVGFRDQVARRAAGLTAGTRIAVLTERDLDTVVAIVAALTAGATVVPVNHHSGPRELAHQLRDARPTQLGGAARALAAFRARHAAESDVGRMLEDLADWPIDCGPFDDPVDGPAGGAASPPLPAPPAPETPALVIYTSGTTGPPKGVVLSHGAIEANLTMLAEAWAWTPADRLVHALPLYHVHGLVLGTLGPIHLGGGLHHLGDFDVTATGAALHGGATMLFGVPTMYHRLVEAAASDPKLARALGGARLLVSGSAGLPGPVHQRIRDLTGQVVVERYGMTETMITTAVPAGTRDKAGTVGPPLPGVELRVVDDGGRPVASDGRAMGEIQVRTPAMFTGYLDDPPATAASFVDGWFVTGDTATVDADGFIRIVGRSSTDIIKCGGFKIGAGEVEDALLEHPDVAEVAVRGLPDDDLGERVAAWVVPRPGTSPNGEELAEFAAAALSRHKRPREVFLVASLPRNAMGKVQKRHLGPVTGADRLAPGEAGA